MIKVNEQHLVGNKDWWEYTAKTHYYPICRICSDGFLSWGSGGLMAGYSTIEVADAMIQAFTMAKERLIQIEKLKP